MYRTDLLGRLMQNYGKAICVAGTHGKTTTTSMLAEIFMAANTDPTVMNGSVLPSMGGAVRIGGRDFIMAEACEYHNSFLKLNPTIGIILNVEMDHSDYFANIDAVHASFASFAQKIPKNGLLAINSDTPALPRLIRGLDCDVVAFGQGGPIRPDNIRFGSDGYPVFDVVNSNGKLGEIILKVPGHHNIQNAMDAITAAMHCNMPFATISAALARFTGALRRFQHIGKYNGATIVDDYAHHPTEVAATISAAKKMPAGRLWVAFQPHTRARTAEFLNEFAAELSQADHPIVLDIYNPAGREEEQYNVHSKDLAAKITNPNCLYLPSFQATVDHLQQHLAPNDLLITMGAGDVHQIATSLVNMH
jgi:UDP-N-acetylmuramate--alanine ligase